MTLNEFPATCNGCGAAAPAGSGRLVRVEVISAGTVEWRVESCPACRLLKRFCYGCFQHKAEHSFVGDACVDCAADVQ